MIFCGVTVQVSLFQVPTEAVKRLKGRFDETASGPTPASVSAKAVPREQVKRLTARFEEKAASAAASVPKPGGHHASAASAPTSQMRSEEDIVAHFPQRVKNRESESDVDWGEAPAAPQAHLGGSHRTTSW